MLAAVIRSITQPRKEPAMVGAPANQNVVEPEPRLLDMTMKEAAKAIVRRYERALAGGKTRTDNQRPTTVQKMPSMSAARSVSLTRK